MNLPNYFLADLPPEATLSAAMVKEACQTLKRNREQYLAGRSTKSLIKTLSALAESWLDPEYPLRRIALEKGPAATGFSQPTLVHGLESFFSELTSDNLHRLLLQELGHEQRLDSMIATHAGQKAQCAAIANGPELMVHIGAGIIPNPIFMNIVLGLLVRSAQFVKCASGTSFLPRLFAHSIYENDPKLAACLELAEWRGGSASLETALFEEADCVTATGRDETLAEIRRHLPIRTRFLGYGHRVSFGYVAHEALSGFHAKKIVARAADDVIAWNQLGCLSPHLFYVEHGGGISAEQFAELLAEELARREVSHPRGDLASHAAATIASKRGFYQLRSW